jgi:hypothetical protein
VGGGDARAKVQVPIKIQFLKGGLNRGRVGVWRGIFALEGDGTGPCGGGELGLFLGALVVFLEGSERFSLLLDRH